MKKTVTAKTHKQLLKEYKEFLKDCIGYCQDRVDLGIGDQSKKEIENYIKDYDAEGDFENIAWESGYLRGIQYAINLLSINNKE